MLISFQNRRKKTHTQRETTVFQGHLKELYIKFSIFL